MSARTLRDRLSARSNAELTELLRRRDTAEWRPEVFPLVEEIRSERSVDPPEVQPVAVSVPDEAVARPEGVLTDVASFSSVVAADACRSALVAAGFAVTVLDEFMLQQDPSLGPV